jgi:hypothetical protein
MERAVELLDGWRRLAPQDHWPLVRQAIIEQERGNAERRAEAIDRALGLTSGQQRAGVAFLGARLALRASLRSQESGVRSQKKRKSEYSRFRLNILGSEFSVLNSAFHHKGDIAPLPSLQIDTLRCSYRSVDA